MLSAGTAKQWGSGRLQAMAPGDERGRGDASEQADDADRQRPRTQPGRAQLPSRTAPVAQLHLPGSFSRIATGDEWALGKQLAGASSCQLAVSRYQSLTFVYTSLNGRCLALPARARVTPDGEHHWPIITPHTCRRGRLPAPLT